MTNLNVITHRDTVQQIAKLISEKSHRIDQLLVDYGHRKAQLDKLNTEQAEFTREPFILVEQAGHLFKQSPTRLQESQRRAQLKKDLEKAQKDFDQVAPEFEQLQAELALLRTQAEELEINKPTVTTDDFDAMVNRLKAARDHLNKIQSTLDGLQSQDIQQLETEIDHARANVDALSADLALGTAKPQTVAKARDKLQAATKAHTEALGINVDSAAVKRGLLAKLEAAQQELDQAQADAQTVFLAHRAAIDQKAFDLISLKIDEIDEIADTLRQSEAIRVNLGAGSLYDWQSIKIQGFDQFEGTSIKPNPDDQAYKKADILMSDIGLFI